MAKAKISKNDNLRADKFLEYVNSEFLKLHKSYEDYFWSSYMGDHSVDKKKDEALKQLEDFRSDSTLFTKAELLMKEREVTPDQKDKIGAWIKFFKCYQTPHNLKKLRNEITKLETKMHKVMATRKEGYLDPYTKKFVKVSELKMRGMLRTESDEKLRKAAFEGSEKIALSNLTDYIKYVGLLNRYARGLGFSDFYEYKIFTEEGMTKKELFAIFDDVYKKTKFAFKNIRGLEKKIPGLRKPWNFPFMIAGDFTKEEDQYFPFDEAIVRWGRSFAAMGIDYRGSTLNLDLLDRPGKYNNGFCHWPIPIHFKNGSRKVGQSNFTCNVVYGQLGSSARGYHTLFHEGGHAAHMLNSDQTEICLNHEYPPMSTAWAETHSMFLDHVYSSYEWKTRYAKNKSGATYPFDLFKRKVERLSILTPLGISSILAVCNFENKIYTEKNLTKDKVLTFAKQVWRKYQDYSHDSLLLLTVPHIYSWNSACSYHGYGLATLALTQWRKYFYKKYGYIVDNPKVGEEMACVWKLGSSKTFKEFVVLATGDKLSAGPWLEEVTMSIPATLKKSKTRAERLRKVPELKRPINLNANISMLSGKKKIANNSKSFEDMANKYAKWLETQKIK